MYTGWDTKNVLTVHIFPVILKFFSSHVKISLLVVWILSVQFSSTCEAHLSLRNYTPRIFNFFFQVKFKNVSTHFFFFYFQATWLLMSFCLFLAWKWETNLLWWIVHETHLAHFAKTMLYRLYTKQWSFTAASKFILFTLLQFLIPFRSLQSPVLILNISSASTKARGENGHPAEFQIPQLKKKVWMQTTVAHTAFGVFHQNTDTVHKVDTKTKIFESLKTP